MTELLKIDDTSFIQFGESLKSNFLVSQNCALKAIIDSKRFEFDGKDKFIDALIDQEAFA